jgi:glycosyltransferase involved in cell wall biosynthesis
MTIKHSQPKVSVILPVYNCEKYIGEAIKSILNQTLQDFELIIINDGSTDNSLEVIKSITNKSNKVNIIDQENTGLIGALNNGLLAAKGEYIARMDADDISFPHRFELQAKLLDENPIVGVCGTSTESFGAANGVNIRSSNNDDLQSILLFWPPFSHPTIMFRRSVLEDNNIIYDINFKHCEDFAMWSDLAKVCQFSNVTDVLLKYRVHDEQISSIMSEDVKQKHHEICAKNLSVYNIELMQSDFLPYIAKEVHPQGIIWAIEKYKEILQKTTSSESIEQHSMLKMLSKVMKHQLDNFYGLRGLVILKNEFPELYRCLPFKVWVKGALVRDLKKVIKKLRGI